MQSRRCLRSHGVVFARKSDWHTAALLMTLDGDVTCPLPFRHLLLLQLLLSPLVHYSGKTHTTCCLSTRQPSGRPLTSSFPRVWCFVLAGRAAAALLEVDFRRRVFAVSCRNLSTKWMYLGPGGAEHSVSSIRFCLRSSFSSQANHFTPQLASRRSLSAKGSLLDLHSHIHSILHLTSQEHVASEATCPPRSILS